MTAIAEVVVWVAVRLTRRPPAERDEDDDERVASANGTPRYQEEVPRT